jgi:DNA invertase Pin-like site-specific DNA recombinase
MSKRVALYMRVSTGGQSVEMQRQALLGAAERHGWHVVEEFVDQGISGKHGRDKRPALDAMSKGIARKQFDLVAAWSLDRLGRSLRHVIELGDLLREKGVDLFLDRQGIDTSTAAGRAMFGMLGVFAEFEREMIRERVLAGVAKAKAQGKVLGRPSIGEAKEDAVRAALAGGLSIRAAARECGVSVGTAHRLAA